MITAIDTSVLLDIFTADPRHGPGSRAALRRCVREGRVEACEVVWAEVAAAFPEPAAAQVALEGLGVGFSPLDARGALEAGRLFAEYHRRRGSRTRVIADFLVGAHAWSRADRLLTRDRGFFRTYFADLAIVDPSQ